MQINTRNTFINLAILVLFCCEAIDGARLRRQASGSEVSEDMTDDELKFGYLEEDVNDPQFKQLAEESLKKYLQQSENDKAHKVVSILKVTKEILAGTVTEIVFTVSPTGEDSKFICDSRVFQPSWSSEKDIEVDCEHNNERVKRGIPSGVSDAVVNDPQYKQLAEESLDKYLQQSGNAKAHEVVSILKVTKQIVAGTITEIDFTVSPTGEDSKLNCHSKVFEQSWTNTKNIDVTCEPNN